MRPAISRIVMAVAFGTAVPSPSQAQRDGASAAVSAASPAVRRLEEVLAVVNSGDPGAVKAYLEANSISPRTGSWDATLLPLLLEMYRTSRGLDLVRVTTVGPQQVQPQLAGTTVGILRNRTTGDDQPVAIMVETQPPHRITGLPILHPSLAGNLAWRNPSAARTEGAQLEEIGAYLARMAEADIFSGVVVIARDGKPVFGQAYGYADREKQVVNTLATPFMLGSMNKLFTGLAIGQLVEQGKLSYDDPLSKFLPDFPDRESAGRIRIKHLLSHTAGLGDYGTNKAYYEALDGVTTVQAIVDVAGQGPLKFEPGTKWAYSNTGFVILGRVIEIVTGEDYYDYMVKHVFGPAGMTTASFPQYPRSGVATVPMAYPYEIEFDGEQQRAVNKLGVYFRRGSPSGVGLASAVDLIRLDNALRAGQVVAPATFRLHATPKPELGASIYGYGIAVGMRTANGHAMVGHGGNASGMCTEFGTVTGTPYTIIILSNLTIGTCVSVNERIMRVLTPPAAGIDVPVATLDRYVGRYAAASGLTITFRRDGSTMFITPGANPEAPLTARTETRFTDPRGPTIEFQLDRSGRVTGLVLERKGAQGMERVPLQRTG